MDFTYSNAFLQSSQRDILTQDGRRKSCLANDDVRSSFIYSSMVLGAVKCEKERYCA